MRPTKPTAHRVGSLLLAVLLVASMVVAPMTGTVAAQEESACDNVPLANLLVPGWYCDFADDYGEIDTDQSASLIKTDLHVTGQGIYERQQATDILTHNYLEDTETIALLEARHAIASAYEDGESAGQAEIRASAAVYDYYSRVQQNALEQHKRDIAQYQYMRNITEDHAEIDDEFVHPWPVTHHRPLDYTGSINWYIENTTAQTVNGTSIEYPTLWGDGDMEYVNSGHPEHGSTDQWEGPFTLERYNPDTGNFDGDARFRWGGGFQLHNHPDAGLESETMLDFSITANTWLTAADQAEKVTNNFENSTLVDDLYAAMDAGDLSPADVRGAEGTIRYLSGDAEDVTDEDYQYALRSVLDMGRSESLDETFVVHFNGSTERERVTDGESSASYEYNHVNTTYEGMLFASDAPAGGFVVGETYDVEALNGSTMMVTTDGEDVPFYRGNMTLLEVYDADGNALESVEWDAGPSYLTYNASEFIDALENASDERSEIVNSGDGGGVDWGGLLPDSFDALGSPLLGTGILVAAIGFVVVAIKR